MYKSTQVCGSVVRKSVREEIRHSCRKGTLKEVIATRGTNRSASITDEKYISSWKRRVNGVEGALKSRHRENSVLGASLRKRKHISFTGTLVFRERKSCHNISTTLRRMLMVSIAHAMDPVQRAGQTELSNERGAIKFGRKAKRKNRRRGLKSFMGMLLKLFLVLAVPTMFDSNFITDCLLKSLQSRFKPEKDKKKNRVSHKKSAVVSCFK